MSELITPALFTSCYGAKALIIGSGQAAIRTSLGAPRWKLDYTIAGVCREIMPDRPMLGLGFHEYEVAYRAKLERVGADVIQQAFCELSQAASGRDLILLCFEDLTKPDLWCHRRIFADWWTEKTGQVVLELKAAISAESKQARLF